MPAEQESRRKLAAILSADVAGYSRLMGEDESATVATLRAYRDVFARLVGEHSGRIVDTAGDSVLAVFDSVVEAVRCAGKIQQALGAKNRELPATRRMEYRVGVNLGDVIEQTDGSIYGDGVNIAARIQALAESGGICLSGTAYDQVKNKIPLSIDPLGNKPLKNISDPVRVYRVRFLADSATRPSRIGVSTILRAHRKGLLVAISVLVVALGAVALWRYSVQPGTSPTKVVAGPAPTLRLPDKPSIAVLPFLNMSEDPEQEYFSDGMTEDIITSLSKLSGLFVIARNSVFLYKGHSIKPQQVSQDLGVRYVLEGSVRKAGNRVRITAQLIDATTGYHLWAEHYDGEMKDIFSLQDAITKQIVAALAPKLTPAERSRPGREETKSVEAYDLVLRGTALYLQQRRESNETARQLFESAIALDPSYARAYVWLAWSYFSDWEYQWTEDPGALDRAIEAGRKASALDDSLSEAHTVLGWHSLWKKRHEFAIAELERAVSLDPNSAVAYTFLAEALNLAGRPDEAIGFAKKALRLDPNYPFWEVFHLADSYFLLRRYDEAIANIQDTLRRNPNFLPARRTLAVIYAELGREKEAQAEVSEMLRISPEASLERWRERMAFRNPADLERYMAGLRQAGLK